MIDQEVPRWQRLVALVVTCLAVALLVVFRDRIPADFWPPDASRIAPNIIASVLIWGFMLMVAALLWPPTRRRIHGFVTGHLKPLHDNHEELKRHMEHIIKHHPDIPDLPKK